MSQIGKKTTGHKTKYKSYTILLPRGILGLTSRPRLDHKLPWGYSNNYCHDRELETPSVIDALSSTTLYYLVVTLSVVLLLKYLFTSSLPANIPPFPARAYPMLGHLPYLKKGTREPLNKWTSVEIQTTHSCTYIDNSFRPSLSRFVLFLVDSGFFYIMKQCYTVR